MPSIFFLHVKQLQHLHFVHADAVHPEEDRVDCPGRDDGVEHPLEEAPDPLCDHDLPGHAQDGGGAGRGLLDHLIWSIVRTELSNWSIV